MRNRYKRLSSLSRPRHVGANLLAHWIEGSALLVLVVGAGCAQTNDDAGPGGSSRQVTGGTSVADGGTPSGGNGGEGGQADPMATGGRDTDGGGGAKATGGQDGYGGQGGERSDSAIGKGALGKPCASLGAFACDQGNEKRALLCDGALWTFRESCDDDERCDHEPGPNQGICRAQTCVPGELLCDGGDVVECAETGFDTASMEECRAGCASGRCNDTDDECVEFDGNCFGGCMAESEPEGCFTEANCAGFWSNTDLDFEELTVRVKNDQLCSLEECNRKRFLVLIEGQDEQAVRVQVGSGWGLASFEGDGGGQDKESACGTLTEACVVLPRLSRMFRGVSLIPLTDDARARNLLIEAVAPDTTCP